MAPHSADVLTAIVTCNGADTISDTLRACHAAARHFGVIQIIDNASNDATVQLCADLALPGVQISRLPKNIGVAAAYNLALARARRMGARWLFLLDQDTRCDTDCLALLLEAAGKIGKPCQPPGAFCPTVINRQFPDMVHYPYCWNEGRFKPRVVDMAQALPDQIEVDSSLTSGTLYAVDALRAIQGFCHKYFIDFVDHECHLRLRRQKFKLFWVPRARVDHRLGCRQTMTPEGLWIEHAPFRYYYMMRNMLEGYYRLAGMPALARFGMDALRHCRLILRYGQAPRTTLRYIAKGVLHAIQGKFGALDAP